MEDKEFQEIKRIVELGGGSFVKKNRAQRRKRVINRLFTRKGYIQHLNAIRVIRRKNGVTKTKYVHLDKEEV